MRGSGVGRRCWIGSRRAVAHIRAPIRVFANPFLAIVLFLLLYLFKYVFDRIIPTFDNSI